MSVLNPQPTKPLRFKNVEQLEKMAELIRKYKEEQNGKKQPN